MQVVQATRWLLLPLIASLAAGVAAVSCSEAPSLPSIAAGDKYPQASSATFPFSGVGDCKFEHEGPKPAWHYVHASDYDWVAYCSAAECCKSTRGYMDTVTGVPTWQGRPVS